MSRKIKIAYADNHKVVRTAISKLLNEAGDFEVVYEADNGLELIKYLEKSELLPDICILEIALPLLNGFDTLIEIKKKWEAVGVLILSSFELEFYIIKMILNGADGYLLKSCDYSELKTAIKTINQRKIYYSELVTQTYFHAITTGKIKIPNFTEKEMQVIRLSCSDLSYANIAEKMSATTKSVEGYRDSIFRKIGINSRVSLAIFAIQHGFITLNNYSNISSGIFTK